MTRRTALRGIGRVLPPGGRTMSAAELDTAAWQALTAAKAPVTSVQLAERAGLTKGGALALLTAWTRAGRTTRHTTPGHTGPYLDTYAATTTAAPAGRTPAPAVADRKETPVTPTDQPPAQPDPRVALLGMAHEYAAAGWHVFPLVPGAKTPAVKAWEDRATTDHARIERCWRHAPYGIGLATGPSGLVVIDLDTPKPGAVPPAEWARPGIRPIRTGADVLAVLAERAGQPIPPREYTVTTPSGGLHLYFRHPIGDANGSDPVALLRNTAGTLGWLIDTRAHGGYVVAPPTAIPGGCYQQGRDGRHSLGTIADAEHLPALPTWLADRLAPAPLPPQQPVTVRLAGTGDARRDGYLRAAVDRTLADVAGAPPGGRNKALYGAAVSLGQLVAGGELPADQTTAALVAAGIAVGQTERAAAATVASGIRAGANRPRTLSGATDASVRGPRSDGREAA